MTKKRVYVAFDYDDLDVKQNLIQQSKLPDCPFKLVDSSIAQAVPHNWTQEARKLISESACVIVLCGEQTHQSKGVFTELQIAQELGKPYFLLSATRASTPTRPKNARSTDRIWTFRWPTVAALLEGRTPPADATV
ncbi:MAG TPA: TIR domain-containing protein [Myxococcaceae bacterium]|nr:TIR domain-containing protein [Myxococcaceae bacterium]